MAEKATASVQQLFERTKALDPAHKLAFAGQLVTKGINDLAISVAKLAIEELERTEPESEGR